MPISIDRGGLLSRTIRIATTGNSLTRKLDLGGKLESNQSDGSASASGISGVFRSLKDVGKRLISFISKVIVSGINLSVTAIFSTFVQASQFISTFDWNAGDGEIQQRIQANNIALSALWGSALGSGVGWVAGIALGYGVTVFCPVIGSAKLAKLISGKVSLEALEEFQGTLTSTVRGTLSVIGSNLFLSGYRSLRKLAGINPPDSAPSWTLAEKFEERIESIKSPALRAFVEGFTDEFFDSFIEAGYIFAYELDAQLANAKAANQDGPDQAFKLIPDKDVPGEAITMVAPERQAIALVQSTLAQHKLIYNRDLGQLIGQPVEEYLRATPLRRKLVIVFRSIEKPPWRDRQGMRPRSASYSIPDPKAGLSWDQIKRAAKPFQWGKFRATAKLTNGRQMAIYGATPAEAQDKLKELMVLCDAQISALSITEERDRNPALRKNATRMFPCYATYLVRRPTVDPQARSDLSGNKWEQSLIRFRLWTDQQPDEWDDVRNVLSGND